MIQISKLQNLRVGMGFSFENVNHACFKLLLCRSFKNNNSRGAWVVQSVKHPTLVFGSVHDLKALRLSLMSDSFFKNNNSILEKLSYVFKLLQQRLFAYKINGSLMIYHIILSKYYSVPTLPYSFKS